MKKILAGLILVACLSGCVAGIGGTEKTEHATIGQELIDLKKARDEGAVTETEYNELKQRIMRTETE